MEVKQQATDDGKQPQKSDCTAVLSMSRRVTESAKKKPKNINMWWMHDKALNMQRE